MRAGASRGIRRARRGRDDPPIRPATPIRPAPPIRPAARLCVLGSAGAALPSSRFGRSPRRTEPADGRRSLVGPRLGRGVRACPDAWVIGVPAISPFGAPPPGGSGLGTGRVWVELGRLGGSASRPGLSVGVASGGMRSAAAGGGGSGCGAGSSVANTRGVRVPGRGGSADGRRPAGGGSSTGGVGVGAGGDGGLWGGLRVRSIGFGLVSAAARDAFAVGGDFGRRVTTGVGNPGGTTPCRLFPPARGGGSPVASAIVASRAASSSGERSGPGELRPRPCPGSSDMATHHKPGASPGTPNDGYEALIDLPARVHMPLGTHLQPRTITCWLPGDPPCRPLPDLKARTTARALRHVTCPCKMLTLTAWPFTCNGRQGLPCVAVDDSLAVWVGATAGGGAGMATGGGVGVGTVLGVGKTDRGAVPLCAEVLLELAPPPCTIPTTTTISSRASRGGYSRRTLRDPLFGRPAAERGVRDRRQPPVRRPLRLCECGRCCQIRPPARLRRRVPAGVPSEAVDLISLG